ncbi:MAG: hypothetical protein Q8R47_02350 [Nanoarchaeota archaeon]|nr:hypothetical protein [Nanoarchaeota archaeon]
MFKKLREVVSENKRMLIGSTITAAITMSGPALWNSVAHTNVMEDSPYTLTLYKKDGWWIAHSSIEISYARNDLVLYRTDPFGRGNRRYSDSNRDGILDAVKIEKPWFSIGGVEGTFNTQSNDSTHGQLLETEKKLYQQELHEFAEQYQKQYPEKFKQLGLEKILSP